MVGTVGDPEEIEEIYTLNDGKGENDQIEVEEPITEGGGQTETKAAKKTKKPPVKPKTSASTAGVVTRSKKINTQAEQPSATTIAGEDSEKEPEPDQEISGEETSEGEKDNTVTRLQEVIKKMSHQMETLCEEMARLKAKSMSDTSEEETGFQHQKKSQTRVYVEKPPRKQGKGDTIKRGGSHYVLPEISSQNRRQSYSSEDQTFAVTNEDIQEMIRKQIKEIGISDSTQSRKRVGRPYPKHFDKEPFPKRYTVPRFRMFDGTGTRVTPEQHLTHFLTACGDTADNPAWLLRQFPQSLSGIAFEWYASLEESSINSWEEMADAFCSKFMVVTEEITMIQMAGVRLKKGESIMEYITRWRNLSIRCQPPIKEVDQVKMIINNLPVWIRSHLLPIQITGFQRLVTLVSQYEALNQEGWTPSTGPRIEREKGKERNRKTDTKLAGSSRKIDGERVNQVEKQR